MWICLGAGGSGWLKRGVQGCVARSCSPNCRGCVNGESVRVRLFTVEIRGRGVCVCVHPHTLAQAVAAEASVTRSVLFTLVRV